MRVITIKQPFATLIAEGYKQYEFRSWKTKYRGEILIHAGKGVDTKAMKRFEYLNLAYPTSTIVAKCVITDCIEVTDDFRDILRKIDPIVYAGVLYNKGGYSDEFAFKLENISKINIPNIKGKLSLWEYRDNI